MSYHQKHKYMLFNTNNEAYYIQRLNTAADKRVEPQRTICWDTLQSLGQQERAEQLLPSQ
jgi:hypothetical protein